MLRFYIHPNFWFSPAIVWYAGVQAKDHDFFACARSCSRHPVFKPDTMFLQRGNLNNEQKNTLSINRRRSLVSRCFMCVRDRFNCTQYNSGSSRATGRRLKGVDDLLANLKVRHRSFLRRRLQDFLYCQVIIMAFRQNKSVDLVKDNSKRRIGQTPLIDSAAGVSVILRR